MPSIRFIRETGRICDLFYIFILYFNKNLWLSNFVNANKVKSDTDFYNSTLNEFLDIPDELFLFSYMKNDSKSFLFKYYFFDLYADIPFDYNFENVKNEISDVKKFSENFLEFYFPENKNDVDFTENNYLERISELIFESDYTDLIKHRLLAFFVNPHKNVQKLLHELVAKDALLNKYYEKNYIKAVKAQENFDFKWFMQTTSEMNRLNKKIYEVGAQDNIIVSICIIAKNIVLSVLEKNAILFVLGYDYEDTLKMVMSQKNEFKLSAFGKILSEKNRILILDMLLNAGELTTSDIAKNLEISVNAAFYHLDMMSSANMLLFRNQGRAVYYRINSLYFADANNSILKYGKNLLRRNEYEEMEKTIG